MRTPFPDLAERFATIQLEADEPLLVKILNIVEPRLTSISMVYVAGNPILHGTIGRNRPVPIPLMGEGIARLAELAIHIADARGGIVLVDEIENGFHYSVLPMLWKTIAEAAHHFDVQLFCTSHSRECILAAHEAFAESKSYDFRLDRLETEDGATKAVTYNRKTLTAAVEADFEVR
jgi:AAA15 family ATPase/GTPase